VGLLIQVKTLCMCGCFLTQVKTCSACMCFLTHIKTCSAERYFLAHIKPYCVYILRPCCAYFWALLFTFLSIVTPKHDILYLVFSHFAFHHSHVISSLYPWFLLAMFLAVCCTTDLNLTVNISVSNLDLILLPWMKLVAACYSRMFISACQSSWRHNRNTIVNYAL
jgi:hypothetical protein